MNAPPDPAALPARVTSAAVHEAAELLFAAPDWWPMGRVGSALGTFSS